MLRLSFYVKRRKRVCVDLDVKVRNKQLSLISANMGYLSSKSLSAAVSHKCKNETEKHLVVQPIS
jgi:hypothetical protein